MRIHIPFKSLVSGAALSLLLACGGAHTGPGPEAPAVSTGFEYVDPKGAEWNLVRNAASTDTHLVLDLVGPVGGKGRGIGFNLQSDGHIAFARMGAAGYVRDTGVFSLLSTFANYPVEPVLLAGGVKQNGTLLSVGVFQKDRYRTAKAVDRPVLQIALDFDPARTGTLPIGTAIPLAVTKAKAIPAFIGTMPANPDDPNANWNSVVAYYDRSLVPVQVAVGTLKTK